ncbi:glycosyltransferase family 39 protein [Thiobacter aerophilum]|uniref:Glycosyltransferase family 39 protein n=1 Tax=Thiobacter aerophilum TaxID=3121275 RepID=A0ABV0EBB2_9BURK
MLIFPRAVSVLLLVLFTLLWFGNLDYRHLIRPDEGRYAEIAREMVQSGDWITPRLNGIKYFEKPPLQYWATAAAYRLFGEHEWTARLWTALTGWAGVLLAWFAGRRLFGQTAGLIAALVLGSSAYYVLGGHVNTLDMGVSFFLQLSWTAFLLAQTREKQSTRRNWMLLAWTAAALALLSKGLIGLVLPATTLVTYCLFTRDFQIWRRLYLLPGLALFLLLAAPWFIAVSVANPEFAQFFFIHEHVQRFLTRIHNRYHPWYTYFPLLVLGSLPWLGSLFPALARAWATECGQQRFRPRLFLLLWVIVVVGFFSVSQSKLPGYILPVFPALALLIGDAWARAPTRSLRLQHAIGLAAVVIVTLAGVVAFERYAQAEPVLYGRYALWLAAAGALLIFALVLAQRWLTREKRLAAALVTALGGLLAAQAVVTGHEALAPINSGYDFARKLRPLLRPEQTLYCVEMYDQTLPFYLKRTCTLVAYEDEMAFGLAQEPWRRGPDLDTFLHRFPTERAAVAILSPESYDRLKDRLPHRLLVREREHVAIAPPQAASQ